MVDIHFLLFIFLHFLFYVSSYKSSILSVAVFLLPEQRPLQATVEWVQCSDCLEMPSFAFIREGQPHAAELQVHGDFWHPAAPVPFRSSNRGYC